LGDYIIKYCLVPSSETQKKAYEETVKPDSHPNYILSDWLTEFHAKHDAEYLFPGSAERESRGPPVEYAGKVLEYPWQTVAEVLIFKIV
jgi:hypothetical protein